MQGRQLIIRTIITPDLRRPYVVLLHSKFQDRSHRGRFRQIHLWELRCGRKSQGAFPYVHSGAVEQNQSENFMCCARKSSNPNNSLLRCVINIMLFTINCLLHLKNQQLFLSVRTACSEYCSNPENVGIVDFVILRWLYNTSEEQTYEKQVGFRTGRGCIGQTITLGQLLKQFCLLTTGSQTSAQHSSLSIDPQLRHCLLRPGVPEKHLPNFRELYRHVSEVIISSRRLQWSKTRLSYKFIAFSIEDILRSVLSNLLDHGA